MWYHVEMRCYVELRMCKSTSALWFAEDSSVRFIGIDSFENPSLFPWVWVLHVQHSYMNQIFKFQFGHLARFTNVSLYNRSKSLAASWIFSNKACRLSLYCPYRRLCVSQASTVIISQSLLLPWRFDQQTLKWKCPGEKHSKGIESTQAGTYRLRFKSCLASVQSRDRAQMTDFYLLQLSHV